jgi:membrane protein
MIRRLRTVVPAAWQRFSEDGGMFFAQALAFNAMFAIFPIGLLGLATFAFIYGDERGRHEFEGLIHALAPAVKDILTQNFEQAVNLRGISGLIGAATLLWSGKNLFLGVTYSLDKALRVPKSRHFVADIAAAIVIMPVIGLILVAATVVPIALSLLIRATHWPYERTFTEIATYAAGTVLIFFICALLYTVLPNVKLPWYFGIPGAAVTAFCWTVAQVAFAIYTAHVNFTLVYGALTALVILLLYLYYQATIFLFGAHFSAQWAEYDRSAARSRESELTQVTA